MEVQVTTTEDNQRVKLDGTVTIQVDTDVTATSFQYGLAFDLTRPPSPPLAFIPQGGNYLKTPGVNANTQDLYQWHPNFTLVNVPGPAGNYTYRVLVSESVLISRVGIDSISARNLGLTATVFPPA
ncbi:hypothetical protein [Peribacillus simplex]|uniref:hypothetical protein n=1 Tax=Peribacillus simplex TaxID=1478 RepID=UPI00366E9F29